MLQTSEVEDDGCLATQLILVSIMDDHFFYDQVNPASHHHCNKTNQENFEPQLCHEVPELEGFDFTWPYITYKGLKNYQYIYNANYKNVIHRIALPSDLVSVKKTFITELLDIYILAETEDQFVLMKIDLDDFGNKEAKKSQQFVLEEIMRYPREAVDN